ncbi:hypothetical protein MMC17_000005 [Xylographa soralifera]|nr:hypothetical protein [Xylographa soralifera]
MEGSLDDLIRYLLDEIALCGDQGALPFYVLSRLDHYFKKNVHDGELTDTVDRPFQEQVWKWLARHPEIKVGRNGEANCMSLTDVMAHNERVEGLTQQSVAGVTLVNTSLTANHALMGPDANITSATDQRAITGGAESQSLQSASVPLPSEIPSYLHVFASVNRMWWAVAGHGIDNEKIAALEFTCLSIIAASRENGILQPELVRVTGQDKRSVPWRTQKLCDRGYIVKKEVVASRARTSLCILKRFAVQSSSKDVTAKDQYLISHPNSIKTGDKDYVDTKSRVVETRLRATFDILKELKIILWDDLKMKLGIWRIAPESRRFAVTVRKLEMLKCVQRVRASDEKYGALHRCIKLLREPTKEEYDMLCDTKHRMAEFMLEKQHDDSKDDLENYSIDPPTQIAVGSDDTTLLNNDASPAKVLMWTPDRLMVNILRDAVNYWGSKGMSSMDIKNTVIGTLFERPIESLLARLVEVWQLSQPLHLRHLAILRDTTLRGKTQHYVYYGYGVFKSLVDAGKASWEAVETVKVNNPKDQVLNAAPDAIPDVDEYGFPKLDKARFQGRDNNATLAGSLAAAKITEFRVTASDASITRLKDGRYTINRGSFHVPRMLKSNRPSIGQGDNKDVIFSDAKRRKGRTDEKKVTKDPNQLEDSEIARRPRGRPRKHPKVGLPENASGLTLKQLHVIKASQRAAMEYERTKITNKIASRVELGEEEADLTEYVPAEVTARDKINPDPALSEAVESLASTARKRKRPTTEGKSHISATHVPSVLAYSSLIPNPSEIKNSVSILPPFTALEPSIRPWKKVKFTLTKDNEEISPPYLPSMLAHSLLVCEAPKFSPLESAAVTTLDDLISNMSKQLSPKKLTGPRKRLYRSRRFDSAVGYFPSILAHTNSNLASMSQTSMKTKKTTVTTLDAENDLARMSSNIIFSESDSIRVSTGGLHELNSGDIGEPMETSLDSPQLLYSTRTRSETPPASSGTLQHLIQQTQAIAPSTSRKECVENEPFSASHTADKRPSTLLSSSLCMFSAVEPGHWESKIGYLPSVAAHTHLWLVVPEADFLINMATTDKKIPRPRKKTAKALEVEVMDQMMENSILTQSTQHMRPNLTYEEQLGSIARDELGIHVGKPAFLRKNHGRGRPRQSRLIVFRFPRLSAFSWFIPQPTLTEATNTEPLSSVKHGLLKELDDKTLSSVPKPPLDTSRSHFQLSQTRDEFLSSVRDSIRLSKPAELSYSRPYPATADGTSPSIATTQNKKRKRDSASTDTRRPLRMKTNIDAPSIKNSQPKVWSLEMVPPLPKSPTFKQGIPSNAEVATLVPSEEPNVAQSVHSMDVSAHGSNFPKSTFIYTNTSCTSNAAPFGIANSSDGFGVSASPTTIIHDTTEATEVFNLSSSASQDAEDVEAQYEDATGRTREENMSLAETTSMVLSATQKTCATNQNGVQDTLLLPNSRKVTAGATSIYTTESNFAKSKGVHFVEAAVASTTTGRDTTLDSPQRDQIRPESVPNINRLDSWLPENCEQTHDSLSIQGSVTPDFKAFTGVRNISSVVVPDSLSNQEEQRETLNTTKDTTSQTPMETTLDRPENPEFVLESSMKTLTDSKGAPTIIRVSATGGSVAVLRRKIIMEIIEQCGGVFPGDREIWQPFCDVWRSRNGGGKPDHRTVLAAVKYLVDNGKLRKLKFTFNHEGVATTRSIVTSPDILPTDPKVKDLRQKMIDHVDTSSRPIPYIPEEARIFMTPVEVVDKPIRNPSLQEIFNRSWTNSVEVTEEQVKLQYPKRLKLSSKGLLILQGMEKRRKEKEERQAGLKDDIEEDTSTPNIETGNYRPSRTLALSEVIGTHTFRWRKFDRTTDEISMPKSRGIDRIRKATLAEGIAGTISTRTNTNSRRLMRLHVNSKSRPNFLSQSIGGSVRQGGQSLNKIPKTSAGNAYQHLHFMEVMDQHSNFDKELSPEPVDINQEQNEWLPVDRRHGRPNSPGQGDLLNIQPEHLRSKVGRFKANKIHKIIQNQLQEIGLQYRIAARQKRTKFIDMQVSALMDPEHLFHVTTGTFSTSFVGMLDMPEVPDLPEYASMGRFHDPMENTEEDLPQSLEDVLARPYDTKLVAHMERLVRVGFNPNHDPFLELVDRVRKWELGTPSLANTISKDWQFINFQLLGSQETVKEVFQTSVFIDTGIGGGMKQIHRRKSTHASPRPVVPAKRPAPVPKQATRRSNLTRPSATRISANEVPADADGRVFKKITLRGPKLGTVSSEDDDRILIAVLIVRTLVGGSEQFIDWVLLARMFGSKFSERLLHRRWVVVRVRYKRNLEKLQSDFQNMFLQAYENGTIPPLDFDNYDNYDWNSLVDWTMKNLETPVNNLNKDLPNTRTELDGLFELRKPLVAASELALFYELESLCSVPRRQVVIHRKPHVIPVHTPSTNIKESSLHDIAKTWVRANVITPDEGYDANLARDKLISLGEPNVEAAVKDLLSARVILHANKGRLIPGRNYDMTEYCLTRLRRKIETHTFRQAAVYKAYLDIRFEEEGSVAFSYHTVDAEIMAVLNLAAHGRISILPKNPPVEQFGLVDNGYRTRHMDKARLNFDTELKPTASYVSGNPLPPLPPPPGSASCTFSSSPDDIAQFLGVSVGSEPTMERFPFWVGINNSFVPVAWDLALAAVLSLVVVQPGVSPSELAKTLRPALEAWEVVLIFQWCVQAGVATWADEHAGKSRNGGVKVAEWWWMVYGEGETGEEMDMGEG